MRGGREGGDEKGSSICLTNKIMLSGNVREKFFVTKEEAIRFKASTEVVEMLKHNS